MGSNLMLLFTSALWGFWGIADKIAVSRSSPYAVQWMYSIPYILAAPLWYWLSIRNNPSATIVNMDARTFAWATGASIASMCASVLLLSAMQSRSASVAVALTSGYPLITLLIALALRMETITTQKIVGMAVVVLGVVILQAAK